MSGDKHTSIASVEEAEAKSTPAAGEAEQSPEQPSGPSDEAAGASGGVGVEKAAESHEAPSPDALKHQLEEARRTVETHRENLLRSRAELENLRKRSERELENAHKYGLERMVTELLPVKDSLELGLAAGEGDDARLAKVREGMELTLKMFASALEKFGVTEIDPQGEDFNPEFHQAMTVQEADGKAPNTVISVIQKGYLLNDRLVRPALVIVAK